MRKLIYFCFVFLFLVFGLTSSVFAQADPSDPFVPEIKVFVRTGCGHCEAEEKFLKKLQETQQINVTLYNLSDSKAQLLFESFTSRLGIAKVTPITAIGETYIIGFDAAETTGEEILERLRQTTKAKKLTNLDVLEKNSDVAQSTCDESGLVPCKVESNGVSVSLPFIGRINSAEYPLIALSAILGFFDGFNPCAMWVLVTFLVILLQTGSRKKMAVFAGTFILAEAIMYTAIITVWYKTWNFVKLDSIITPLIGVVSIIGGIIFIREWHKKELECHVTNLQSRSKTHEKLKKLATDQFTFWSFLGVLGIAFSVNIIEFACSIGIPQAFTKILDLNHVSVAQNILMVGVYIFFYMIDDFIVFGLALYGAEKLALTTKYSKLSNLLGGITMIILGLVMIVKPSLILFQ